MSRFALVGHPVGHSVSPAIHRAAYAALGMDHHYELVDCPAESDVRRVVEALGRGELDGVNVTVPHKRLALELADRVDAGAAAIGAANVLARGDGVVAHNTDAPALRSELAELGVGAGRALVIGNGGAALAAVVACRELGLGPIDVVARGFRGPEPWPRGDGLRALGAGLLAWPSAGLALPECTLVVQATSSGMLGGDPGDQVAGIVDWQSLPSSAVAYDLVYNPARTPFLEAARARGLENAGGLGMLVGQAALAIELWLGVAPPRAPLLRAAQAALEDRA